MPETSEADAARCPTCGHVFTFGELWRMAVENEPRWIVARLPDGREVPLRFDEFDPRTMTALTPVDKMVGAGVKKLNGHISFDGLRIYADEEIVAFISEAMLAAAAPDNPSPAS